jgi:signal transduction histidine kinase
MTAPGRVLVVEDSRVQARRLVTFLRKHGYSPITAADGKKGLAAAREHGPSLIITDVVMPVMDGFEMCRTIRTDKSLGSVPIIIFTSLSNPEDILRGLEAGADSYVSKPFNESILLSRIRSVLSLPRSAEKDVSPRKLQVVLGGRRYHITASRLRILNLLLSTYEDVVLQNLRLREMRKKLLMLNERLEKMVDERTRSLRIEVAERRKAQSALAEQAEELARSNAELEQFAYVASHDLQEPLRAVASSTQFIAKHYGDKLGPEADEFIGYTVNGVRRMRALINDLLSYSRVGTRGGEFKPVRCELVLTETLQNLRGAVRDKNAVVTHTPLPTVLADATQLGQLFQNLIGNAIKFCGNGPPRVHVSAQRNGREWTFMVRDEGIGIDPEHVDLVFEVFQRLHTDAEYSGTGIGLAICKKIVERHGGRIWVESRLGSGSTFRFTIPVLGAGTEASYGS